MKRRVKFLLVAVALVAVCLLLLFVLPSRALTKGHAELLFELHRERFEEAASLTIQQGSGSGVRTPPGVDDLDLHGTYSGCVEFSMGGFGLVPSSTYWGVIYATEDTPVGWGGLEMEYTWDGHGWRWREENGDNRSYVTKLDDHWYLYEMSF